MRRVSLRVTLTAYLDHAVVALGDWNDILNAPQGNNIFQPLLDAGDFYRFTDLSIAEETNSDRWSFPSYPSHLDHILINRPLFESFQANGMKVRRFLPRPRFVRGLGILSVRLRPSPGGPQASTHLTVDVVKPRRTSKSGGSHSGGFTRQSKASRGVRARLICPRANLLLRLEFEKIDCLNWNRHPISRFMLLRLKRSE